MDKINFELLRMRLEKYIARGALTITQQALVTCLQEALLAGAEGNYPVGSVITNRDHKIISKSRNSVFKPAFRSEAHAEMNAITQFEETFLNTSKEGATLFSTLEPCLMCTARILLSGITKVVFLHRDPSGGMCDQIHLLPPNYRDLGSRVKFIEHKSDSELKAIAKDLYEIGEALWNSEYRL